MKRYNHFAALLLVLSPCSLALAETTASSDATDAELPEDSSVPAATSDSKATSNESKTGEVSDDEVSDDEAQADEAQADEAQAGDAQADETASEAAQPDEPLAAPAKEGGEDGPTGTEKVFEAPEPEAQTTEPDAGIEPSNEAHEDAPPAAELSEDEAALERPYPKQGHFIAIGLGYGMATAKDSDRGWRDVTLGPGYNLRIGESLAPWVDIGLDMHLSMTNGDEKLTLGRITAHAQFYPVEQWFVRTGFGFGFAGGPDPDFEGFDRFGFGDAYHLSLGRQFYLSDANESGGFILSPVTTFEIAPDNDFGTGSLWLGLEISWWSGLARDKLALPPEQAFERNEDD